MTPDPENPQQGKAGDTSPEDAAAAKSNVEETPAQPEPETSETETAPQAEGTAAAETGIDKQAAGLEAAADDDAEAGDVVDPDETEDQQERADAEAARATAAAEEAAKAAEAEPTPTTTAAAKEAEEAAEKAEAAAVDASKKPKREKARKAREAEQAADQAEEAAEEGKKAAQRSRRRRGGKSEEPQAVPVGLKVSAQAKYVRTSARKARLVCDHIRDKDVEEARAILAFTTRDAAKAWSKLLESAVANAEHNHELVGEDLRILNVHADEGPTLKRYRPRAMGRATRIRKRTSHLSITLTPKEL
jgi:ribosomal protein L22